MASKFIRAQHAHVRFEGDHPIAREKFFFQPREQSLSDFRRHDDFDLDVGELRDVRFTRSTRRAASAGRFQMARWPARKLPAQIPRRAGVPHGVPAASPVPSRPELTWKHSSPAPVRTRQSRARWPQIRQRFQDDFCFHSLVVLLIQRNGLPAAPGFEVALNSLQPLRGAPGDLFAQLRHRLGERRAQRMVAAFGEDIRAGRDEVDVHLIRGAGGFQPHEPDVGFVNLARLAEGEDLLFHPRIQVVEGSEVEVLQVQSHGRCHNVFV